VITVLFGPPGSGKGTQASIISERFGVPHISTGEMLREEVAADTDLGREVAPIMSSGELIPDSTMVRVIERRLSKPDAGAGVILDGYPRTVPQAKELDEMFERTSREIGVVLFVAVPEAELQKRIAQRAELDHRADDTPEAFAHRMREYEAKTAPVIDYYQDRGTRVEFVNGNAPVEAVTDAIMAIYGERSPSDEVA
jgi:adenylate kinase